MHTLKIIGLGIALLAFCLVAGRMIRAAKGITIAALVFIPLWLACATANLYVGVTAAGYSVSDELPVLLVVFTVPAVFALAVWWRFRSR